MTIEITHSSARYSYRLSPGDAHVIERRLNRHNARWAAWRLFQSATEARIAIIRMSRTKDDGEEEGQP